MPIKSEVHDRSLFVCVHCMGQLLRRESMLECATCARRYPEVHGIPVLTPGPMTLLNKHQRAFSDARQRLDSLTPAPHESPKSVRWQAARRGLSSNLDVIEKYLAPIRPFVQAHPQDAETMAGWAMSPIEAFIGLLGTPAYFYQDWAGLADPDAVRAVVLSRLLRHSHDLDAAAVLGAGACGMVQAVSDLYRMTYGVDLSVPSLLLAQGLLGGDRVDLCLEQQRWRPFTLTPRTTKGETQLVASDVRQLPFGDSSLSAIVTPHLMDLVPDPLRVISEIARTLSLGGIWINWSFPFRFAEEPREVPEPCMDDIAPVLTTFGFDVVEADRRHSDFDNIFHIGTRSVLEVQFFVARKCETREGMHTSPPARDPLESWWHQVLNVRSQTDLHYTQTWSAGSAAVRESVDIRSFSFNAPQIFRVTQPAYIEALWKRLDGRNTLREVRGGIADAGIEISDMQFHGLITRMLQQYGLLSPSGMGERSRLPSSDCPAP